MKKRRRGREGREGQKMTGKDEEKEMEKEKERRSRSSRSRSVSCLQVLAFVFLFVESQFLYISHNLDQTLLPLAAANSCTVVFTPILQT